MNLIQSIKELGLEYDVESQNYSLNNGPFCSIWVSFRRPNGVIEVGMLDVDDNGMFDEYELFDSDDESDELLTYLKSLVDKMFINDVNTQVNRGIDARKVVDKLNDVVNDNRFEFR